MYIAYRAATSFASVGAKEIGLAQVTEESPQSRASAGLDHRRPAAASVEWESTGEPKALGAKSFSLRTTRDRCRLGREQVGQLNFAAK
jgi:hypothetical protein